MRKFIRNNRKVIWGLIAALVFLLSISASYLLLGNKFPWADKVWVRLANILPLPVATVEGRDIWLDDLRAIERLGIADPMDSAVRLKVILVLGELNDIKVSNEELIDRESSISQGWESNLRSQLNDKDISVKDFRELILKPEIVREKLILKLQNPNEETAQVERRLQEGEDFGRTAASFSNDPVTSALNGDAGFLSRAQIYEPLWDKAVALDDGAWTGPEATPEGFMFVKRLERQAPSEENAERLHLQIILIKTFDFEEWLKAEMEKLRIVIYI